MKIIPIEKQGAQKLVEGLNELLADLAIFYQNARGMHWNIKGKKFFELHARLEQMYQYLAEKADEVAERIKALEAVPLHSFEDFLEKAHIKSRKNISKSDDVVQAVRDDLIQLLERERKLLALAHEIGDEGTAALLSDAIRDQEKMAWMYEAYLD